MTLKDYCVLKKAEPSACFVSPLLNFIFLVSDFVICIKSFEKITPFAARVCCFADVSSICHLFSKLRRGF